MAESGGRMKPSKLMQSINKFQSTQQNIAKKYQCKISIGYEGKEVVIADERKNKNV
jgi:exosome complex RNA-binding protein Rrp4